MAMPTIVVARNPMSFDFHDSIGVTPNQHRRCGDARDLAQVVVIQEPSWWNDVMEPALADLDLRAGEHEIHPVWSLARP